MSKISIFLFLILSTKPANAVTLVFSNDVYGELETCGCRSNPMGGLDRKQNYLLSLKDDLLQLDAGNLLFSSLDPPESLKTQQIEQAKTLLKAHDLMKHDAAVPGTKDFAFGVKTFFDLVKKSKIQYLAANLTYKNKHVFPPYKIFKKKNKDGKTIKIGVFGLLHPQLPWPKSIHIKAPIESAKKIISELKKQNVDLIIALTHQGLENDKKLAQNTDGIDFIVGGGSEAFLQTPLKIKKTFILQSSFRNQYIGVIPHLETKKIPESHLEPLEEKWDDPPGKFSEIHKLIDKFKKNLKKLSVIKITKKTNGTKEYGTFPQCVGCHQVQFDFWRKTNHANALKVLYDSKQLYQRECMNCHSLGKSLTAPLQSYETLAIRSYQKEKKSKYGLKKYSLIEEKISPEEITPFLNKIHSADEKKTMFFRKKDPSYLKGTPSQTIHPFKKIWGSVQCEHCHQTQQNHPFSENPQGSQRITEKTCLKCHNYERSNEWFTSDKKLDKKLFKIKLKMISCPRE